MIKKMPFEISIENIIASVESECISLMIKIRSYKEYSTQVQILDIILIESNGYQRKINGYNDKHLIARGAIEQFEILIPSTIENSTSIVILFKDYWSAEYEEMVRFEYNCGIWSKKEISYIAPSNYKIKWEEASLPELPVIGVSSLNDLVQAVTIEQIHRKLLELLKNCLISNKQYKEYVQAINQNGKYIEAVQEIKMDYNYIKNQYYQRPLEQRRIILENYLLDYEPINVECIVPIEKKKGLHEYSVEDWVIDTKNKKNFEVKNFDKYIPEYLSNERRSNIYPYNYLVDIFSFDTFACFPQNRNDDFWKNLITDLVEERVKIRISKNEQKYLKLIYQYNYTYKDIIEEANLENDLFCIELLKVMHSEILRKSRHPAVSRRFRDYFGEILYRGQFSVDGNLKDEYKKFVDNIKEKVGEYVLKSKKNLRDGLLEYYSKDIIEDMIKDLPELIYKCFAKLKYIPDAKIEDMPLSVRSKNCLKKERISTLGELVNLYYDELVAIRSLGPKCVDEINEILCGYGLCLEGTPYEKKGKQYQSCPFLEKSVEQWEVTEGIKNKFISEGVTSVYRLLISGIEKENYKIPTYDAIIEVLQNIGLTQYEVIECFVYFGKNGFGKDKFDDAKIAVIDGIIDYLEKKMFYPYNVIQNMRDDDLRFTLIGNRLSVKVLEILLQLKYRLMADVVADYESGKLRDKLIENQYKEYEIVLAQVDFAAQTQTYYQIIKRLNSDKRVDDKSQ